ncbi:PLP-dependent aminotransferase family protein [Fluviispira sanaruensis]|uniref:PLP-dependent aminotransferase family protein n=1 Tax=Fluviispira sanaruensis TaxID=2493639 RepID=A0A4V0P266_FLUSA|nr:PLP-dependent aminotransferase family protein [Fluviispira sanaruensis]BBH52157.1 PLP-dependent aminotransferase family protein [Fluviispira sanaruensis]
MVGFQKIQIDRNRKLSFSDQIAEQYEVAIKSGTLLIGTKLPSIRDLSLQLNINKIGVISAYEKLCDSGYITAKRGSGYFVSYKVKRNYKSEQKSLNDFFESKNLNNSNERFSFVEKENVLDQTISLAQLQIQECLPKILPFSNSTNENITYLGNGEPPKNLTVMEDLRAISRVILSSSHTAIFSYSSIQGLTNLREALTFELEQIGMPVLNSAQILISNGALHALNIVLDTYLTAGDSIAIEVPNFALLFPVLSARSLDIIEIKRTQMQLILDENKKNEIRRKKPKIILTYTNCHNPTGGILSSIERHSLLNLAQEINAIIIELDIYKGLNFDEFLPPLLSVMDGLKKTIYISSFSKTFAPGIRLGYIVASEENIQKFILTKLKTDISSSIFDQQLLYEMIIRGVLKKHIQKSRDQYRSKRDTLIAMLKKLAPQNSQWSHPEAGIFLWFKFPEGGDLQKVHQRSLEKQISIAPGHIFYPYGTHSDEMRINFSTLEPVETYNALATVFTIWKNSSQRKWLLKK